MYRSVGGRPALWGLGPRAPWNGNTARSAPRRAAPPAAPTRRSSRARKAPAKGRDAPGKAAKGAEPKMVTVTYKEGDVLGEHLHAIGTLVEVKIPAESTVSGNPQVRRAIETPPIDGEARAWKRAVRCAYPPGRPPAGHPGERPAPRRRSSFPTHP